jgi:hypothetical protein
MLVYPGPGPVVAAGVRIIDGMRAPDRPGVHASVHHGHAIPREGDYFGSVIDATRGGSPARAAAIAAGGAATGADGV